MAILHWKQGLSCDKRRYGTFSHICVKAVGYLLCIRCSKKAIKVQILSLSCPEISIRTIIIFLWDSKTKIKVDIHVIRKLREKNWGGGGKQITKYMNIPEMTALC